jgi:hypothetical protein
MFKRIGKRFLKGLGENGQDWDKVHTHALFIPFLNFIKLASS